MTSVSTRPLTIDEFLALPEQEEPSREFLRGEVIEKPMASELHGRIVMELGRRIGNLLAETDEGIVVTEVRHADRGQDWVFLPDLNVRLITSEDVPQARGPIEAAPTMAAEVLSPDDRLSRWFERVNLYMNSGTRLLWVIDPEEESIRVFRPGMPSGVYRAGDLVSAEPVLPGFEFDIAEFFDFVKRRRRPAATASPAPDGA